MKVSQDADRECTRDHEHEGRMSTEPWVAVEEVAEHLGVAKESVYRWIESRGLPAHKIGRLWKFKLTEVDGWVRAGGAGPGEPDRTEMGEGQ